MLGRILSWGNTLSQSSSRSSLRSDTRKRKSSSTSSHKEKKRKISSPSRSQSGNKMHSKEKSIKLYLVEGKPDSSSISTDTSESIERRRSSHKKHYKRKGKKRAKKHSSSEFESDVSSTSLSQSSHSSSRPRFAVKKKHKEKKHQKVKRCHEKERKSKKKIKHSKEKLSIGPQIVPSEVKTSTKSKIEEGGTPLTDRAKAMAPMTKEEWEKRQSIVRRVYDEETGRHRLIKGDGEVLEEIVSRDRHREINRQATRGDAEFFQATLAAKHRK